MLSVVSLDKNMNPVRNAINYMDNRVKKIKIFRHILTLIYSVSKYKIGSVSSKDVIQKILWIKKNEKRNYKKTYKFMDASDYFASKFTGFFHTSSDNAFVTFMYDPDNNTWDKKILKSYNIEQEKLCNIKKVYESKGIISKQIAEEFDLPEDISIFSGGDLTCISYAAYNNDSNNTNIYWGTSGWVSTLHEKKFMDISSSSTSLLSAVKGHYNFMGQLETTGKALEYILNLLDENYSSIEGIYKETQVGAGGVLFAPWISGERTPFNNPNARSSFTGVGLQTSKKDLIRATIEGICLEYYWELKVIEKHVEIGDYIYFTGGGANSNDICQILSDVLNKTIIVEENCQYAGNYGIAKIICSNLNINLNNTLSRKEFKPNKKIMNIMKTL